MALCGIIKHHDKNEKPCVLGFWHFLTSERIAGFSASLSAVESCKSKDLQDFFIIAPFGRWQKTKFLLRRYFTKKTRCTS